MAAVRRSPNTKGTFVICPAFDQHDCDVQNFAALYELAQSASAITHTARKNNLTSVHLHSWLDVFQVFFAPAPHVGMIVIIETNRLCGLWGIPQNKPTTHERLLVS